MPGADVAQKTCRSLATKWACLKLDRMACLKFMHGGMKVLLLTLAAGSYNDLFERDGGGIYDETETPLLDQCEQLAFACEPWCFSVAAGKVLFTLEVLWIPNIIPHILSA